MSEDSFDDYLGIVSYVEVGKEVSRVGKLVRWEPLILEDGTVFDDKHPVIETDDGREILGLECWWTPGDVSV